MKSTPKFKKSFDARHGEAVEVARNVVRVTCNNMGPFTYTGTNSYIIGAKTLGVIDPGPADDAHFEALLTAIAGRKVSHIFVTHTHMDHSPLAKKLQTKTGAIIVGAAPHFSARQLHLGEVNALDASADRSYVPETILRHGDIVEGDDWAIETIETPGHTANHLAFCLLNTGAVFTGDHIMAWATTIVAPPDGSMRAYMASLDTMLGRDDKLYLPGHGGDLKNPKSFVRGLKAHRKMRERAIIERLEKGDRTIAQMVAEIYRDTDPRLHGAAGLSVYAHIEDLYEANRVRCEAAPSLTCDYWLAE
ncbi:MAG: MBL fold metallo-hydrolase [Ahrensia sp.]|nr:MBL fold metallo-hydrolase [Ahrensia sp.]